MLEKELAQATNMAEKANKKVEQLRKKLLSESEKSNAKTKRELAAARKKHKTASTRLKKARAALRAKTTPDNQQKVDALLKQVQELGEAIAKLSKAALEAAERYVSVRSDAILEARKASAADRAAQLVERATAKSNKKPARKKAAAKKKAAPKKKAAAKKKKAAPKKKAAAKKK